VSGQERGAALLELLVATCVALATLGTIGLALTPLLDVVQAVPEATDLHQRARAAERVLAGALGDAGAGADLMGQGPLSQAGAAVLPRRLGTGGDAPGTAWGDRLTTWQVPDRAAQAPLAETVYPGVATARLDWHPACGSHPSCGFARNDVVLLQSRTGAMALTRLAMVAGLVLTLAEAPDQAIGLPAHAVVVRTTTVLFDPSRRQLRRADDLATSQPVIDDVVAMTVRYYGSAAPPRWPAVAGVDTCAVLADGTPQAGLLGPVPGPPVELTVAHFLDGPWCGSGTWRFDLDLLRVRAIRIEARLQAASVMVRGTAPLWFALAGRARRPAQEVRDVALDVFIPLPNLAWGR
jgi:hypothetical protein